MHMSLFKIIISIFFFLRRKLSVRHSKTIFKIFNLIFIFSANNIDRIFNYKYPYEYIDRFADVLARKDRIFSFYNDP